MPHVACPAWRLGNFYEEAAVGWVEGRIALLSLITKSSHFWNKAHLPTRTLGYDETPYRRGPQLVQAAWAPN